MTYARKLTDEEVLTIRSEYCFNQPHASLRALARRFHVSRQTILHAVKFFTYKRPKGECNGRPTQERCSTVFGRNASDRMAVSGADTGGAVHTLDLAEQPHVLINPRKGIL